MWWIFYGQQKGTNSMNAERIAELRDWINRHAWTDESGPFVSDLLAILDQAEALPELVEAARDLWLKTAVIPVDWKNLEAKELSANAVKSMDAVHAALAKIEAALDKPAPPAETQCPACEGSGKEPIGEHFVTAEMASDGGQPERAGESMGIQYGPCSECGGTGQQRQATEDFAISPEEGKKIMMSVKKFYNAKPVPPYQTTDGTLTFKMPQATTAPPAPGEEEQREMV